MVSVFEVQKYDNNCPFNLWLEEFEDGVLANFGDVANKRRKAILMQVCGEAVKKFVLSLETVERHTFNTMEQEEEESIEYFLMRLKLQAKKCNYVISRRNVEVQVDTDKDRPGSRQNPGPGQN